METLHSDTKAFDTLLARVTREARRRGYRMLLVPSHEAGTPFRRGTLRRGNLLLVEETRQAFWRGRQLILTDAEWRFVHLLASQEGQKVSFAVIYAVVWNKLFLQLGDKSEWTRNVRTLASRTRRKFTKADPSFTGLFGVRGFGYSLCVQEAAASLTRVA